MRFTEVGVEKPRWDLFGVSAGTQVVALIALIWVPLIFLRSQPPKLKYEAHLLTSPPVMEYIPPPPPPPQKFLRDITPPRPKVIKQPEIEPQPKVEPRVVFQPRTVVPRETRKSIPAPEAPKVELGSLNAKLDLGPERPGPRRPQPPVKTGVLASTGSSAPATLTNRPLEKVQTGGFGDPNGVPASKTAPQRAVNINAFGSPALPAGPGYGNGTGGAKGARGTVASAGFGSGIAISGTGQRERSGGGVQSTSFGTATPTTGGGAAAPASNKPSSAVRTPVEIIAKPNPEYTEEARRLRIEGNVKLNVVFTAGGELRILGMVAGLGHGLDEAAVSAAKKIRFRPAREGNQPVDQPAIVTIEFKLAY